MSNPDIFSRTARRRAFHAAQRAMQADQWLLAQMADELEFRLSAVKRGFENALLMGPGARIMADAKPAHRLIVATPQPIETDLPNIICDEDRLALADHSFDLVMAVGGLDSVNDLPGALILIRRILKPGGLFLGTMAGGGSLGCLRSMLPPDQDILRMHPQIDVRAAGDLMLRAGFALPVADLETVSASYATLDRLFCDIRANALGNCLVQRQPVTRNWRATVANRFETARDGDGRVRESFGLLYLTGWAPDSSS